LQVYLGVCEPDEERTFEKYPARKRGTFGKKTHTGHMPVHAEQAREKWASRYVAVCLFYFSSAVAAATSGAAIVACCRRVVGV